MVFTAIMDAVITANNTAVRIIDRSPASRRPARAAVAAAKNTAAVSTSLFLHLEYTV